MHYVVVTRTDATPDSEMGHYLANVGATLMPFDGRLLAFAAPEKLEGAVAYTKTAVLEFPSGQTAREWYNSAAYRELATWRIGVMGHPVDFSLVPGVE
ncbi:DUF1330 domain-containing protein [Nocardia speluncae]|uniref:DUF1330 domain-containing protein n=1 Tax=Nocardia speluncae TaxID=419477 RepID=A0A846XR60_9NOCA|nr:DUF1330 domain-containing protein [Nocardia speluncae]NKY37260.1 DUF1330 domain-containing protein [Nocardia speluncae]